MKCDGFDSLLLSPDMYDTTCSAVFQLLPYFISFESFPDMLSIIWRIRGVLILQLAFLGSYRVCVRILCRLRCQCQIIIIAHKICSDLSRLQSSLLTATQRITNTTPNCLIYYIKTWCYYLCPHLHHQRLVSKRQYLKKKRRHSNAIKIQRYL